MTRAHDPHARLLKTLAHDAQSFGLAVTFGDVSETPWSSATFTGYRLTMTVRADRDPAAWLAALPEADLSAPGRLVADLAVIRAADAIRLELLVLLEA